MIICRGQGSTAAELPIGVDAACAYFADATAFLRKIEAVDGIRPLGRPGAYLITHHPVGGFGYEVVMAACLQIAWDGPIMTMAPLDFDLAKVATPHPVVKGYIEGRLALDERQPGHTRAAYRFGVTVEIPVPGVLSLVPRPMLQATADGIMTLKSGLVVRSLFEKVLADFRLAPGGLAQI